MSGDPARIPIIIGVGQISDRPDLEQHGLDSIGLMAAAARAAIAYLTDGVVEPIGSTGVTAKFGDTLFWQRPPRHRKELRDGGHRPL